MHTLACDETLVELFRQEGFIAISIVSMICLTIIVGTITGAVASVFRTRAKEMTRRELAAYVAEGSLRPEDAVAVLDAGLGKGGSARA